MNREEKKKEKSYRKKDDEPVLSVHRDLPQMCPKYLTKNELW